MSTQFSHLEARMSVQERLTTGLQVRIEELSQDMTASFGQLARYQMEQECQLDARFAEVKAEIAGVRAEMATKDDLIALETRILDAFKQLMTMMDTRLPPSP